MLGMLFFAMFLKIAVIFILFLIDVLIFLISSFFLIFNIVRRYKGKLKRKVIPITLPVIGIVVSCLFFIPFFNLYAEVKKEQVKIHKFDIDYEELKKDTKSRIIVFWEEEVIDGEPREYFVYKDRKYIKYKDFNDYRMDKRLYIAGIDEIIETEEYSDAIILNTEQPKKSFFSGLAGVLFNNGRDYNREVLFKRIHAVKNRDDLSILVLKYKHSSVEEMFFDEKYYSEIIDYYDNIDNYNFIVSKTDDNSFVFHGFSGMYEYETISKPLTRADYDRLSLNKDDTVFTGNKEYKEGGYDYVNIFGVSRDGVYKKLLKHYLIDDDAIYSINVYIYLYAFENAVILNDKEAALLLSLLE